MLALEEEHMVLIILLARVLAGNRGPPQMDTGAEFTKKIDRSRGWNW